MEESKLESLPPLSSITSLSGVSQFLDKESLLAGRLCFSEPEPLGATNLPEKPIH